MEVATDRDVDGRLGASEQKDRRVLRHAISPPWIRAGFDQHAISGAASF